MAQASCLCGKVQFTAKIKDGRMMACHCTQCQRWTGGGPLFAVRVSDVEIEGEEAISAYHASDWGERAFCGTCGTTLYWKMQARPIAFLAAGLFDDQSALHVTNEIFVDHRPEWLPPWHDASQSTEAQEHAKLDAFLTQQP